MAIQYTDILGMTSNNIGSARYVDFVQRSDGKILLAYMLSNSIYLKVINSEEEFNTTANHCSNGTLFDGNVVIGRMQPVGLLRLKSGKLLMVINATGKTELGWSIKVYLSDSGTGEDFVLKNTLFSTSVVTGKHESLFTPAFVGKPTQDDRGRIYVSGAEMVPSGGYATSAAKIYYSDDEFSSFVRTSNPYPSGVGVGGPHRMEGVHNITTIGDMVILPYTYRYSSVERRFMCSMDRGATWSTQSFPVVGGAYALGADSFWRDPSGRVFRMSASNVFSLYTRTFTGTPTVDEIKSLAGWDLVQSSFPSYTGKSSSHKAPHHLVMMESGVMHEVHVNIYNSVTAPVTNVAFRREIIESGSRRFVQII